MNTAYRYKAISRARVEDLQLPFKSLTSLPDLSLKTFNYPSRA